MRSILVYLVLVGLPVLGVAAVLRAGRELRAAPFVGGRWRVELLPDPACGVPSSDSAHLEIVQTGRRVELVVDGPAATRLHGQADGRTIRAAQGDSIHLHATVADAGAIEGIVAGYPCPAARRTRIQGRPAPVPTLFH